MGVKLSKNFDGAILEARLQQKGKKAIKGGADEMRKHAKDIEKLAQDIAPHKSGDLENAIYWDDEIGDNRRVEVFVTVDTDQTVHRGFQYANWAHEMITPEGPKGLGKGSLEKATTNKTGLKVGGGYLRRAAQALLGPFRRKVRERIEEELEEDY